MRSFLLFRGDERIEPFNGIETQVRDISSIHLLQLFVNRPFFLIKKNDGLGVGVERGCGDTKMT